MGGNTSGDSRVPRCFPVGNRTVSRLFGWGLHSFPGLLAGATAQPLAAGCLLAAMLLRDSSHPVGASPPYGWGVLLASKPA